jgi:hypothetical protein
MNDLRISLVQGDTRWHDPAGNRAYYGALLAPLAGTPRPKAWMARPWPGCTNKRRRWTRR